MCTSKQSHINNYTNQAFINYKHPHDRVLNKHVKP